MTPELTDDNSTVSYKFFLTRLPLTRLQRARSISTTSSYKDFDDEEENSGISRSRLHPDEARSLFSPAQIDARDVDFSDRVTAKRKSYRASSRRQRKRGEETEDYGDSSDGDDDESLERRLARLRREIEEVKGEYSKRNAEKNGSTGEDDEDGGDIAELSKMLDGISASRPNGAGAKLAKDIGTGMKVNGTSQVAGEPATYTVTYAPQYQQSHALARAADFDGRLALLEKILGLNNTELPKMGDNGIPKAILPTLEILQRQMSVISESTPSSLDNISRRVRTLTEDANRLEESRKSAKTALDALRAAGGDIAAEEGEDSEQVSKINALFGTLSTIDNLAPLLPSILDRLRSLRAIHADAATASESLERVEKSQEDMAGDIKKWKEGLEKMEEAMKQGERTMNGNMKVVEGWVKDLEAKMEKL